MIVGCDRVAANGDVANKVGTYAHALAARAAGIPFVVAGPTSTIDASIASGDEIVIEERDADEVRHAGGALLTPADTPCRNPAFDVTPAELVSALVTERGIAAAADARVGAGHCWRCRSGSKRHEGRAVADARARSSIEEQPDPVAGPGEVVCRVLACGVCGSDVSETTSSRKLPAVLGHEVVGEVLATGDGVGAVARRRPRRHPPPRAVRRVPALPARPRDALRPVPRDRAGSRRLRRAGAPRARARRRAARARRPRPASRGPSSSRSAASCARSTARACARATRCSSSARARTGCSRSPPRTRAPSSAVWIREPRDDRRRAARGAGAPRITPTSRSTSRS